MDKDIKIDATVAEVEFQRFVDSMDLDINTDGMDDDEKKDLSLQKGRVISAIMRGSLVINDEGEPVFTPQREEGEDITFHEPTGAALMAMDRKKQSEEISKMFAAMAAITKTHSKIFSKMKMSDLKVCLAITTLFLG